MTSTPVMGSEGLFNLNYLNQTSTKSKADLGGFGDFLKQSNNSMDIQSKATAVNKLSKTEKVANMSPKNSETIANKAKVADTSVASEVNDDSQVADVMEAVEEVVETIKNELQVTDEDIANALETLGLTLISLLDLERMPEIVAKLTNQEDTLSIATNQDIYESFNNILDKVENVINELAAKLDIEVPELKEAIKINEKVETLDSNSFAKALSEASTKEPVSDEKELEEKIVVNDNRKVKPEAKTEETLKEVSDKPQETASVAKLETKRDDARDTHHEAKDNSMTGFVNNIIEKAVQALNGETSVESFTTFDVKNVLNQITESIKFELTNDVNEVSLRLHPETLGTVNVKVTANSEGVMTAQFTAQNEQVKAIIESQAVVLKETLESKGVTVQAVEVLVESHEFDRNLNGEHRGQEEGRGSRKPRRINLLEDDELEVSEGDEVIKEMMAQNGNTIDYSA